MDFILRFDVLRTKVLLLVSIGQKYQKRGITDRKRAKTENLYLNAHLHINTMSHIYFHENPSNGLGGVAITSFF